MKIDFNELKTVVICLNKSGFLEECGIDKIKTIGKKVDALLKEFAEAVEKIPDDKASDLPEDVVNFYMTYVNPIEESPSSEEEESPEEETKEENPKEEGEEKMKKVEKKKLVEKKPVAKEKAVPKKKEAPAPKKTEKKEKPVEKKPVKKEEKKPVAKKKAVEKKPRQSNVEKDLFGYKKGSQANIIDEKIINGGATIAEMAKACKSTESRVRSHLYTLIKLKGIPIVIKDGKYTYSKKGKK